MRMRLIPRSMRAELNMPPVREIRIASFKVSKTQTSGASRAKNAIMQTMSNTGRHIDSPRPQIRQLNEAAINRIAAGEVIERPSSAVKELVENALDAGAARIDVAYADGGKTFISVSDDGHGMTPGELPLALARHATSKIDGSDLLDIGTFGFRGEALPSLGAVGRLTITSKAETHEAAEITVAGGRTGDVKPAARNAGTTVILRDLFFATPARLKFMRTDRAEAQAMADTVKRLAMAKPLVEFTLRDVTQKDRERVVFRADVEGGSPEEAIIARMGKVLGKEFTDNAVLLDMNRENLHLKGCASLPTYSRGSTAAQYFYVNSRPIRDKMFYGAVRGAYRDLITKDRHPAAVLFITCDPRRVDANVHPAKSEVRFRNPGHARDLIVSCLRSALAGTGNRTSSTLSDAALGSMRREAVHDNPGQAGISRRQLMQSPTRRSLSASHAAQAPAFQDIERQYSGRVETEAREAPAADDADESMPLGAARAQVHENYIISQTSNGIVIVDQHAAHERLVYERLKRQLAESGIHTQALLIPDIVEMPPSDADRLLEAASKLAKLGLVIEPFGPGAIAIQETPAILGQVNCSLLLRDILDEIEEEGGSQLLEAKINSVLSRIACHGSIRSGRRLRAEEMNALLREMEETPHSGQCNHGRPTYVELPLSEIEKLFQRS